MKDNVYQKRLEVLKNKRASAEGNIQKYAAFIDKWKKDLRRIDLEIMELNSTYNKLSADELTEAIAMYKKAQMQTQESSTADQTESAERSDEHKKENFISYGGNRDHE